MLPQTLPTDAHLIAPDTFLVPTLAADPSGGGVFAANSMVIRGAEPVIVDTGCSLLRERVARHRPLCGRPRRRALGVHLPRRPRPHREPRDRARPLPAGGPRRELGDDRPPHGRPRAARAPDALARPGRCPRRRRPHPAARAPAPVRLAGHPRPVRPDHRRAVGRGHVRSTRAGRHRRGRRRRPRPVGRVLRRDEHVEHPLARVGRRGPLRRPCRHDGEPPAAGGGQCPRPDPAR